MKANELKAALSTRSSEWGLLYSLMPGAADEALASLEVRLAAKLPPGVRHFYSFADGLVVESPALEIFSISMLVKEEEGLVPFARVDRRHLLAWDCSRLNEANEWNIVTHTTKALITKTMASFWSNKLFAWIDNRRPIWVPASYPPLE